MTHSPTIGMFADENGPNVIAAELVADPIGDDAGANNAVTRVYPLPTGISFPAALVGACVASAAQQAVACETAAPRSAKSR